MWYCEDHSKWFAVLYLLLLYVTLHITPSTPITVQYCANHSEDTDES